MIQHFQGHPVHSGLIAQQALSCHSHAQSQDIAQTLPCQLVTCVMLDSSAQFSAQPVHTALTKAWSRKYLVPKGVIVQMEQAAQHCAQPSTTAHQGEELPSFVSKVIGALNQA